MNIDKILRKGKELCGEKTSRGREYIEWIDTKPKVFLPFREWMFSYHPEEFKNM